MAKTNADGQTFGSWLLAQRDGSGPVASLIVAAKADRAFPRYGTPEEVRAHLTSLRAGDDMLRAVDAAEAGWMR